MQWYDYFGLFVLLYPGIMAAYWTISALLYFLIRKNCDDCRLLYSSIFHDKNCAAYGSAPTEDYNKRPSEKSNYRNRPPENQPPIRDLGQLMIITRPRYRNRHILIRHFVLTTLTWLMWLAMIYFISRDYRQIFSRPVLDGQTLPQLAKTVLLVILLQFNLLLSWSLITGSAMRKRMRRQRKNNKQNTGKAV